MKVIEMKKTVGKQTVTLTGGSLLRCGGPETSAGAACGLPVYVGRCPSPSAG